MPRDSGRDSTRRDFQSSRSCSSADERAGNHEMSFRAERGILLCVGWFTEQDQGEIPRGVYPERQSEILRSAQNDKRRAQNGKRRAQE